jgi:rare lipoprotein A
MASHYGVGDGYGGRRTASGERMNPRDMTAAHRSLPFGTSVRVCHQSHHHFADTGKMVSHQCIAVRINDRGPFVKGRCIDLSWGASRALGCGGLCRVTLGRV